MIGTAGLLLHCSSQTVVTMLLMPFVRVMRARTSTVTVRAAGPARSWRLSLRRNRPASVFGNRLVVAIQNRRGLASGRRMLICGGSAGTAAGRDSDERVPDRFGVCDELPAPQ